MYFYHFLHNSELINAQLAPVHVAGGCGEVHFRGYHRTFWQWIQIKADTLHSGLLLPQSEYCIHTEIIFTFRKMRFFGLFSSGSLWIWNKLMWIDVKIHFPPMNAAAHKLSVKIDSNSPGVQVYGKRKAYTNNNSPIRKQRAARSPPRAGQHSAPESEPLFSCGAPARQQCSQRSPLHQRWPLSPMAPLPR